MIFVMKEGRKMFILIIRKLVSNNQKVVFKKQISYTQYLRLSILALAFS